MLVLSTVLGGTRFGVSPAVTVGSRQNKRTPLATEKAKTALAAEQRGLPQSDVEQLRRIGYRIIDLAVREFAAPAARPPFPRRRSRADMEALFGGALPRDGMDPADLLDVIERDLLPASGNPNHPGLMAFILTGSTPLAAMLEALVATIKLRPTLWRNQPASCHIETTVTRWLGEMVGYATDACGYLTSGGSSANLAALAVARIQRAGWDVRAEGVAGCPPLVAYVSSEAHSCMERSAQLLGLGSQHLRRIPVDVDYRIRVADLRRSVEADRAAGLQPFCVIGNAGTVNTGAVDPLDELADVCEQHGLWFHVDGAYGAFAAMVPEVQPLFGGLTRANSLTVDPHKWLNTPFEAGCLLVRHWEDLRRTFSLIPAYLETAAGDGHDQYEYGFELSRTDRALKVWIALRQHGTDQYAGMISHHLELARHLARQVAQADDLELIAAPQLSTCCFRYLPRDLAGSAGTHASYLDNLNDGIEVGLERAGLALISSTTLRGRRVLRACIASHAVTEESVSVMLAQVREIGRRLHVQP